MGQLLQNLERTFLHHLELAHQNQPINILNFTGAMDVWPEIARKKGKEITCPLLPVLQKVAKTIDIN